MEHEIVAVSHGGTYLCAPVGQDPKNHDGTGFMIEPNGTRHPAGKIHQILKQQPWEPYEGSQDILPGLLRGQRL